MRALLCIDRLGTKARIRDGGAAAAAVWFDDFADLVLDTVATIDCSRDVHGEIEADWCALHCPTVESALALGRRVFRRAWFEPQRADDERLWLRGCVTTGADAVLVRRGASEAELPGITRHAFAPDVLQALAVLRSGFRGMRLLVADDLLGDALRGAFRIPLGRLGVIPFRKMNHTPYPARLGGAFQDFLWMADTGQEWHHYALRMKQRLLWAAHDAAECRQAAATQIVFHECDAILGSVVRKNQLRRHDEFVAALDRSAAQGPR